MKGPGIMIRSMDRELVFIRITLFILGRCSGIRGMGMGSILGLMEKRMKESGRMIGWRGVGCIGVLEEWCLEGRSGVIIMCRAIYLLIL